MSSLPTRDDYYQTGADEVLSRSQLRPEGQRISRAAVFTEGTDINIILAACAAMADEATRQLAMRLAALYLESAEGEDLDRLVADRFSPELTRHQAQASTVILEFTRSIPPSAGAGITYGVGHRFRSTRGTEFRLVQAATFAPGSTGPTLAAARCVLAGTVSNCEPNTIREIVAPNPDAAVSVTNPEAASGGRNVESDESFRTRARAFYRAMARGTQDAIQFGAESVPGVASAAVEELLDNDGIQTGWVRVIVADVDGRSNVLLTAAVREELNKWRAWGVVTHVLGAQPQFQAIHYQVGFRSGIDQVAARQQLKALTVSVVNLLRPGEALTLPMLYALARSIPGLTVTEDSILLPSADVPPTEAHNTIRTSLDLVVVNGL